MTKKFLFSDQLAKSPTTAGLVEPHCAVTPVSMRLKHKTQKVTPVSMRWKFEFPISYDCGDDCGHPGLHEVEMHNLQFHMVVVINKMKMHGGDNYIGDGIVC